MRFAWLLLICVSGCAIGGGPVLGYRGGRPTIGWEAGPAVRDPDGGGSQLRLDAGQSFRDGRVFTFGALSAESDIGGDDHRFGGVGGQLGVGGGDDGWSVVVGGSGYVGGQKDVGCGDHPHWTATLSAGVRWASGLEVYVAPRFDVIALPCWPSED
jgi:hypothetical protein